MAGPFRTTKAPWRDPSGAWWYVAFRWMVIDGRYEVVGLELRSAITERQERSLDLPDEPDQQHVEPKRLTAELLRSFQVGEESARHRSEHAETLRADRGEVGVGWIGTGVSGTGAGSPKRWEDARPLGRPPMYDADHWRQVARVYTEAFGRGEPPTKAVAEWGQVEKTTASKWVARCRQYGLLPPTERGKARVVRGEGS